MMYLGVIFLSFLNLQIMFCQIWGILRHISSFFSALIFFLSYYNFNVSMKKFCLPSQYTKIIAAIKPLVSPEETQDRNRMPATKP